MAKKKKPCWDNSKGRKLLCEDLKHKRIPLDVNQMSWEEAFCQRPEFADFDGARLFEGRLETARKFVSHQTEKGASEAAALALDRLIYPEPATNSRGEPRWEGSNAEKLLNKDIDDKKHEQMKPKQMQASRVEHQAHPLDVFRGKIRQRVKTLKCCEHRKHKGLSPLTGPDDLIS